MLGGCSAMMMGGGAGSGSPYEKDERSSAQVEANAGLASSVRRKLAADSRVAMFDLEVQAIGGGIVLSGSVDTYAARERAEKIAIGVDGVASVDNRIVVSNGN
jgi:osmotically-inducible protein OsmY